MPPYPIQVLVVDDEADICSLTKIFLETSRVMEVDTVCSVQEAMTQLAKKRYDVIVSDYQMPELDGLQFLKSLRATGDGTPFILFTGKGREEVVIEALNHGADSYLQKGGKPVPQYAELEQRIQVVVQRHRGEEALLESEERYRTIMDRAADGIILHDEIGRLIDVNQKTCQSLGYSREELLSMSIYDIDPEAIRGGKSNLWDSVFAGQNHTFESHQIRKDGSTLPVEVKLSSVRLPLGSAIIGIVRDITERKRAEIEISSAQAGLREAYHLAHIGTWEWLIENDKVTWSEELYNIAGRDPSLPAPSYAEHPRHYTPASWKKLSHAVEETLANGEPYKLELDMVRPDGTIRVTNAIGSAKRDEKGKIIGLQGMLQDITDHKFVEEQLKESEERFHSAFDWANDAIFLHTFTVGGAPGRFFEVNQVACNLLGYSKEELLNMGGTDVVPPKFHPQLFDIIRHAQENDTFLFEIDFLRKDGTTVPVESSAHLVNFRGKKIWVSHIRDITKRKQIEEALQASNKKLVDIIDFLPDATFVIDLEGRVVAWNQAIEKMTGVSREDMIGQGDYAYSYPFYGVRRRQLVDLLAVEDEEIKQKYVYVTRKGATLYAETFCSHLNDGKGAYMWGIATPIFDEKGKRIGAIESIRDITERKRNEQRLVTAQRKLNEAYHLAQIGTYDWIVDGDIVTWSEGLFEISGRDPSLPPPSFEEQIRLYTPESWERLSTSVTKAIATGEPFDLELDMIRPDGSVRNVSAIGSVERDKEGKVIEFHGLVQDITDQKRAERGFQEANRKLNLLSGITRHDIKNQLMALEGQLALLKMKHPDPLAGEHFRKAEIAGARISAIINFTKEYEDIGVKSPIWQNIRELVQREARGVVLGSIRLVNDIPADLEVYADPLVSKVYHNLIDNAVRHGGNVTTIHFFFESTDGTYAIICQDDGIGITPDVRGGLFMHSSGKGHGFGLFLSREILAITGITIKEEGEPGRGARFVLTMPSGGVRGQKKDGP
jgi:PAS domain S-box-containing protein